MTARLFACALVLALSACEKSPPPLTDAEVQDFVRQYVAAANAADAAKVMGFIQRDETVTSAGLGMIHRGWKAISTATTDAYADPVRIKVSLDKLDVTRLGADTALVVAPISMSSSKPVQIGGNTMTSAPGAMTIVVKRTAEGLRIIHDHYSIRIP